MNVLVEQRDKSADRLQGKSEVVQEFSGLKFPILSGREKFEELDQMVREFVRTGIAAMKALHRIRDEKLYRDKYNSWEDYCDSIHGITRQYGNRLATAGKTLLEMETIVSTMGLPLPESEAHLRELARIRDPKERVEVYRRVSERCERKNEGPFTAAAIKAEVCRSREKQSARSGEIAPNGGTTYRSNGNRSVEQASDRVREQVCFEAVGSVEEEEFLREVVEKLRWAIEEREWGPIEELVEEINDRRAFQRRA